MKKIILGLVVAILFFPNITFAQQAQQQPQPPADLITFQKQQNDEMTAFFSKLSDERKSFYAAHADAAAFVKQQEALSAVRTVVRPQASPLTNVVTIKKHHKKPVFKN